VNSPIEQRRDYVIKLSDIESIFLTHACFYTCTYDVIMPLKPYYIMTNWLFT